MVGILYPSTPHSHIWSFTKGSNSILLQWQTNPKKKNDHKILGYERVYFILQVGPSSGELGPETKQELESETLEECCLLAGL